MKYENILTNGVNQKEVGINGDWDKLKKDVNDLLENINGIITSLVDTNNEKIKGYKNSLITLVNKIKGFSSKISSKNGIVNCNSDDFPNFLENLYYLETEKSLLSLLSSTVNVLTLTKEL